ncbi:substrate-binding periplasmic protein [Mangrovitalea sediminis]|uniref:substrate-binding periplasmic protein n=1 Tax=Mangrovitalea sediminis TaxID=1982043 RepID=UPI000BE5C6C5|nr:transporter substrate-binding domain-containing protein [Mangrovitalea sediminis]
MSRWSRLLVFIAVVPCMLGAWSARAAQPLVVRYFQTDVRYAYRIALLRLALRETRVSDGPFSLQGMTRTVSQARGLRMLAKNEIDVAFLPTDRQREKHFLPVRIPILRGLLGYRVLMIRRGSEERLAGIGTLRELSTLKAGFGSQWADLAILKANGLPVVSVSNYEALFRMLARGRFDYFPRGVNEAWQELDMHPKLQGRLTVERHLALYYPYPVYFFVNQNNAALADRLLRGLEAALKDGSFKQLFLRYNKSDIERAQMRHRTTLVMRNPFLPPRTSPVDTHWWLPASPLESEVPRVLR